MWIALLAVILALLAAALIYLARCFHRLSFLKKLESKKPFLSWLLAVLPLALLGLMSLYSLPGAVVALLHLAAGFLLAALLGRLLEKALRREVSFDCRALFAVLLTAAYLGAGWFFAHHVFETGYAVSTRKDVGDGLRIVLLADAHIGATMDGEGFAREMARIQATHPDVVVVAGDFVDDDTSRADLTAACRALGALETTYGVYLAFGNHDAGYGKHRGFTADDLREIMTENGVTVLEDAGVTFGGRFCLIGRRDRHEPDRMDMERLASEFDRSNYLIVLDHQPNDYDREAAAGVDLVLSGHTHGGHIFPAGPIGLLMGANDRVYGREERGTTTFIVTSGISGWGIPFKTGAISEFVVIDVTAGG